VLAHKTILHELVFLCNTVVLAARGESPAKTVTYGNV
jgi:hypothetical protein